MENQVKHFSLDRDSHAVHVRERFTNLLVRINIYQGHGDSSNQNEEYNSLLKEAHQILVANPEWTDIAKTWLDL